VVGLQREELFTRRFPPPCSAELTPNCFIVRDANGQALNYVYYESEPGQSGHAVPHRIITRNSSKL
jgi:hypothetical protein